MKSFSCTNGMLTCHVVDSTQIGTEATEGDTVKEHLGQGRGVAETSTKSRAKSFSSSSESGRSIRSQGLEYGNTAPLPTIDIEEAEGECNYLMVRKLTSWSYDLKDPELYRQFCEFSWKRRSTTFLLFIVLVSIIFRLPLAIVLVGNAAASNINTWQEIFNLCMCVIMLLCIVFGIVTGIILYMNNNYPHRVWNPSMLKLVGYDSHGDENQTLRKQQLMTCVAFTFAALTEIFYICSFLRMSFRLNCGAPDNSFLARMGEGVCYDHTSAPLVLQSSALMMIVLPLFYFISIPGVNLSHTLILFASACGVFLASVIALKFFNSITVPVLFMFTVFFVMIDIQLKNVTIFITSRSLKEAVKANDKINNENHANEMRHMIANVAHDLKTPLSSFTTGVDYIQITLDECRSKLKETCAHEFLQEALTSVHSCLSNIRNTNSFMLMTINRCIDFTKASKGLKLVPHHETIDLVETLQLPLHCMQNIQNRVEIKCKEMSKEICSHIITDKQWLQENVLCLLSNAVKYSNGGTVEITVSLERQAILHDDDKDFEKHEAVIPVERVHIPIKASNKVRPETDPVYFSTRRESFAPTEFLRFEVEDTGIGMTEEAMASLFNPFKQNQRLAGGTGLGLYSLAKRAEALGGEYGVRKRKDEKQGSLFWFTVPYKADEVSADNARLMEGDNSRKFGSIRIRSKAGQLMETKMHHTASSVTVGTSTSALTTQERFEVPPSSEGGTKPAQAAEGEDTLLDILIADDSPSIIKMTTLMLKRLGHRIVVAENGETAIQIIQEEWKSNHRKFDIVLMDLQMPVMDGLEATRRIRKIEKDHGNHLSDGFFPHQVVIGVSANSDNDTMEEAFSAGVDAFISKPFNIATFSTTVENLLNGLPGHKHSQAQHTSN